MKVAIIGAGLSGLSCAYELERLGIKPVIFEKKGYVGDFLEYTVCDLKIFNRFIRSSKKYLQKNYNFKIKPINKLKKIIMISPKKKSIITGNQGYIFIKGRDEVSLENQILSYFNPKIVFDSYVKISDIKDDYDYVVSATGDVSTAKEYGIFKQTFNGFSRLATVLGSFDENSITMWMDTEYLRNGYFYILPYNSKKAYMVLSVNNITFTELDYYWNSFLKSKKFKYTITETRDVEHQLGFVNPVQVDNVYLIGNAGGSMDSFMGFGFISAIESGILAARAIAHNLDYNKLMEPIMKDVKLKHEYRIMMNRMTNKDFDRMITFLDFPGVKQLLYKNPLYKASFGAYPVKLLNKAKHNDNKTLIP